MRTRLFLTLLAFSPLGAAPVPHPERPDRLVETRDGFSVEYSPGQEAWMEMAFERMQVEAREPIVAPPTPAPEERAFPGTAHDLRERREALLAAVARQTGLPAATALQGRTFDTFLGYYDLMTEVMRSGGASFPSVMNVRRLAIWQRDDLIRRLRAGAQLPGISYDPATDSGRFDYRWDTDSSTTTNERIRAIRTAIDAQRLDHTFDYSHGTASASVSLRTPAPKPVAQPEAAATKTEAAAELIIPIIYRGELATPPTTVAFASVGHQLRESITELVRQATHYRDATIVSIIMHEITEVGLVENLIASRDRRWLCEGTANYVAWRVTKDLIGPDFAAQVYNLDAQLRLYTAQQPKIDLAGWVAAENAKDDHAGPDLNRAHYAFATRAMFLLAEHHGENSLAQLWADVARTSRKKVSAKTFATAYRKRFKGNLAELITEAQMKPIPPVVAASLPKS